MTAEQDYYENDGLWSTENVRPSDSERFQRTIELVPQGIASVLDVGCGKGRFLGLLRQQRPDIGTLHGADRSQSVLQHVSTECTRAGIDDLPFPDRGFDLVSSLQVLEHLPAQIFDRGIAELARVSARYLLVSVPCNENLRDGLIACPRCCSCFSPFSHLNSFSEDDFQRLFSQHGFRPERIISLGLFQQLVGWTKIRRLAAAEPPGANPYSFPIACPVCNQQLPGCSSSSVLHDSDDRHGRTGLRKLIRHLWPKSAKTVSMAGLFRRDD